MWCRRFGRHDADALPFHSRSMSSTLADAFPNENFVIDPARIIVVLEGDQLGYDLRWKALPVPARVAKQRFHVGAEGLRVPPRCRDEVDNPRVETKKGGRTDVGRQAFHPP